MMALLPALLLFQATTQGPPVEIVRSGPQARAHVLIVFAPMDLSARTRAIDEARRLLRELRGRAVEVEVIDGPRQAQRTTADLAEVEGALDRNVTPLRNPGPRDALDPSWPRRTHEALRELASRAGSQSSAVYFLETDIHDATASLVRWGIEANVAIDPVFMGNLEVAVPLGEASASGAASAWSNTTPVDGVPMRDLGAVASASFDEWSRQRSQLERLAKATGGVLVTGETHSIVERISASGPNTDVRPTIP